MFSALDLEPGSGEYGRMMVREILDYGSTPGW